MSAHHPSLYGYLLPHLLNEQTDPANYLDVNKNGDLEPLRFPEFHQELLSQNYWNAGDDLGRIKVVIAEGLHRESPAMPYDRIKNIVAFSFQHAPLGM